LDEYIKPTDSIFGSFKFEGEFAGESIEVKAEKTSDELAYAMA
jgi:hypothetical protein